MDDSSGGKGLSSWEARLEADEYQEVLYNAIMEWVLRKVPAGLDQAIMIDDTDKINSIVAIDVLTGFY